MTSFSGIFGIYIDFFAMNVKVIITSVHITKIATFKLAQLCEPWILPNITNQRW